VNSKHDSGKALKRRFSELRSCEPFLSSLESYYRERGRRDRKAHLDYMREQSRRETRELLKKYEGKKKRRAEKIAAMSFLRASC